MGKHRERRSDQEFQSGASKNHDIDFEYELDDEQFFEQFESSSAHTKNKRRRNARRLIDELRENRQLEDSIDEYYFHTDD